MSREVSPKDAVTVWKLYRLFLRERPDVVHTHTAKAGTVGRVAGLLYRWLTPSALVGRPRAVPLRPHLPRPHLPQLLRPLEDALLPRRRAGCWRASRPTASSSSARSSYEEIHGQFGVGRRRAVPRHPARPRPRAPSTTGPSRRARAAARVGRGRRRRARRHRRPADRDQEPRLFLEAAALFKQRRAPSGRRRRPRRASSSSATATCAPSSKGRRGRSGSRDDVTFTGTRDDPENFYPALDVVALTSLNEGTPLTLIEAMANARPASRRPSAASSICSAASAAMGVAPRARVAGLRARRAGRARRRGGLRRGARAPRRATTALRARAGRARARVRRARITRSSVCSRTCARLYEELARRPAASRRADRRVARGRASRAVARLNVRAAAGARV